MPQLDPSTYASQIFWLLVTFIPMFLILWRVALPKIGDILQTRQRRIDEDLERATALKDEAEEVLAEYQKALADAQAEAQALHRKAQEEMAAVAAERQAELGTRLAERTAEAETRIAEARKAALADLRSMAVEVASAATSRLIGVTPAETEVSQAVDAAAEGRA
jgi:F-type H+-transporting ATPase subunit b